MDNIKNTLKNEFDNLCTTRIKLKQFESCNEGEFLLSEFRYDNNSTFSINVMKEKNDLFINIVAYCHKEEMFYKIREFYKKIKKLFSSKFKDMVNYHYTGKISMIPFAVIKYQKLNIEESAIYTMFQNGLTRLQISEILSKSKKEIDHILQRIQWKLVA